LSIPLVLIPSEVRSRVFEGAFFIFLGF
jgi:hypothetical protein